MRIRNPDGSEAGACGNATRCVASLVAAETGRSQVVIRTITGDLPTEALPGGLWRADMGPARLDWREVPLAAAMDTLHLPLAPGGWPTRRPSHGQPARHLLRAGTDAVPIDSLGPALEHDPLFPQRANIGLAQVLTPEHIRLRGLGTRRRADPGLWLRRLRRAGQCRPPRPDRPPRHRQPARRRSGDRMARGRACADDRPGRHRLHRQPRPGAYPSLTVELLTFGCRLNTYESEAMRDLATAAAMPTRSSSTPAPSPPRPSARPARRSAARRATTPPPASSSPAAPRRSPRIAGPRCPASPGSSAMPTS